MSIRAGLRIEDRGLRGEGRAGIFSILNPQSSFLLLQRGASLIELIMFIVIVSSALAGIMVVLNQTSKGSADPMIRKQALAVAYSLLEEIELQDFSPAAGMTGTAATQANRTSVYHIVSDYDGFSMPAGITSVNGAAVQGLSGYQARVTVVPEAAAWNGIPAGSAVQINVTVTAPGVGAITATGYRTAY